MSERETTATVPWRRWWAAAAVALSLVFLLALMASHAGAALGDRNPRRRTLAEEGATETRHGCRDKRERKREYSRGCGYAGW